MIKKLSYLLTVLFLLSSQVLSEEKSMNNEHLYNFYIVNFHFSDDKQSALLFGFQHQNETLERDSFMGNISPITGGFITENSAIYVYSGIEWNIGMGSFEFTPSFAPGLYHEGDGKDLGHVLELRI